jgi:hypothetical protein
MVSTLVLVCNLGYMSDGLPAPQERTFLKLGHILETCEHQSSCPPAVTA